MNLKEISFEPAALVEFSASDVNILMELSKAHYDGVCKAAGQWNGFLYGLSNSAPDYRSRLNNSQIQTLVKICEIGTAAGRPLAREIARELVGVLNKMESSSPDVITFKDSIKEGELAWLLENDCFGTKSMVRVVKIHKGGNAIVLEGGRKRECRVGNLRPSNP